MASNSSPPMVSNPSPSMADGLGKRAVDSHEVRRKQGNQHLNSKSADSHESAGTLKYSPNPSFVQSNVYPLRSNQRSKRTTDPYTHQPNPEEHNHSAPIRGVQSPNRTEDLTPPQIPIFAQNHNSHTSSTGPISPTKTSPNHHTIKPIIPSLNQPKSPSPIHTSPARKLQGIFQQEEENQACKDRISSIVQSLEDEMANSGVNINLSHLKSHILQVREEYSKPDAASNYVEINLEGAFVKVEDDSLQQELPKEPATVVKPGKTPNWASLFKAQAPSKTMKLEHFPDMQQGKDAVVELDDSDVDSDSWDHCLIGYFLDGKMPYNLLCATARTVWKDNAPKSIKQIGACFFFEFRDEATKLQVLEGGPYFFSRRYLVLTDWKRMLVPTTNHPSSIPAWVKLHKLPLECWTELGFSRIASSIGRPIHVDEATAGKKRLDFARVCVEVSADDDLPDVIVVKANGEAVSIRVEYQWLPPKCSECKVFGHKCNPKPIPAPTNPDAAWQTVGSKATISNKDPEVQHKVQLALGKGGSTALDVVTKVVESLPQPHKSSGSFKQDLGLNLLDPPSTGDGDDDISENCEEILADTLTPTKGLEVPIHSPNTKQIPITQAATSSPTSTCPQSAGSNTKKNKNKKKGRFWRPDLSKGQ